MALVTTALLMLLWIAVTVASPWIAPGVAQIANDLDLRYGFSSSSTEPE